MVLWYTTVTLWLCYYPLCRWKRGGSQKKLILHIMVREKAKVLFSNFEWFCVGIWKQIKIQFRLSFLRAFFLERRKMVFPCHKFVHLFLGLIQSLSPVDFLAFWFHFGQIWWLLSWQHWERNTNLDRRTKTFSIERKNGQKKVSAPISELLTLFSGYFSVFFSMWPTLEKGKNWSENFRGFVVKWFFRFFPLFWVIRILVHFNWTSGTFLLSTTFGFVWLRIWKNSFRRLTCQFLGDWVFEEFAWGIFSIFG